MAPPVPGLRAVPPAGPLPGPGLSGGSLWHCRPRGVAKTAALRLPRSGGRHLDRKFLSLHTLLCAKLWQRSFSARTSSKNGKLSGVLVNTLGPFNSKTYWGGPESRKSWPLRSRPYWRPLLQGPCYARGSQGVRSGAVAQEVSPKRRRYACRGQGRGVWIGNSCRFTHFYVPNFGRNHF